MSGCGIGPGLIKNWIILTGRRENQKQIIKTPVQKWINMASGLKVTVELEKVLFVMVSEMALIQSELFPMA